jgi:hypothetical protein
MRKVWLQTLAPVILLLAAALPAIAADEKPAPPAQTPPADVDIDLVAVSAPPVGAPHERIASGARSEDSPHPILFASSQTGCTIHERPTFYWYLTKSTDCDVEMDLVHMEAGVRTSVFKKVWEGVKEPGVYSFEGSDADGKPLQLNAEYQVTVTIMLSKTQNAASSGFVMRVTPPAGITAQSDASAFAKAGIWYDAIDAVSRKIDANPSDASARRMRRGFLWTQHVFSLMSAQADPSAAQPAEADQLRDFAKHEKPMGTK